MTDRGVMKNTLKKVFIGIVIALAVYGAYSITIKLKLYIAYKVHFSHIAREENIKNGIEKIPNLKLIAPDGSIISLYNEAKIHRYTIVSFGSIYCANCHKEYKILQEKKFFNKLPGNVAFYICVPEKAKYINEFKKDKGIKLPIYTANKKDIDQYGISNIPTTIIIGKDLKLKWPPIEGFTESTMNSILQFIK